VLEQLGDTKEKGSSFLSRESLACVQQVDDPSQESPTFPRRDGGFIECPSFLDDRGFVVVERCLLVEIFCEIVVAYRVHLILRPF
jgi:hypothetical protein